jgi:hypothetical protein
MQHFFNKIPAQVWWAVLIVVSVLIYSPLVMNQLRVVAEYQLYTNSATLMIQGQGTGITLPHFLYPLYVAIIEVLTRFDLNSSANITMTSQYVLMGVLMYAVIRQVLPQKISWYWHVLVIIFAVMLCTIAPIALDVLRMPRNLLFGFLPPNPHHNPTTMIARPYALATVMLAILIFQQMPSEPRKWLKQAGWIALSALITVLGVLAKPSYTIAVIPALGLYVFWRGIVLRQSVNFVWAIFGFAVPAIVVLLWQYQLNYSSGATSDRLSFMPFAVWLFYGDTYSSLLLKFVQSAIFPLLITVSFYSEWKDDSGFKIAWLAFVIACLQGYLLAEDGVSFSHGNVVWGMLIGLLILFVYATRIFVKVAYRYVEEKRFSIPLILSAFMLVLHICAGIVWYAAHLRPISILQQ